MIIIIINIKINKEPITIPAIILVFTVSSFLIHFNTPSIDLISY